MKRVFVIIGLIIIVLIVLAIWWFFSYFGLGLADNRTPVQWISEPGNYGPGDYGRKMQWGKLERFYEIHVPPSYSGEPLPVVMVFHGGGGYPGYVRYSSRMSEIADREGFIVVYPAGSPQSLFKDRLLVWNAGGCCGRAMDNNVDDVGFVNAILDDAAKFFRVDSKRIFATGISNGAQMTYRVGIELSDRIAAIAPISAPTTTKKAPKRPLSVMHFHGLADEDVPFNGGTGIGVTGFNHISVTENMQFWIAQDQCPSEPTATDRKNKAVMTQWGPCAEGTEVVLWVLEDGGHTWPGSRTIKKGSVEVGTGRGYVNTDISTSELMWEFFKKHPMK